MHYFATQGEVKAVDGVSFSLDRGQALGIVGESGCGKSSIAISLLKLLPDNARFLGGHIYLDGVDLFPLSEDEMRKYRWNKISMIFQAAMNSLDPVYTVGDQIAEAPDLHIGLTRKETRDRIVEWFDLVCLDPGFIGRYPHE